MRVPYRVILVDDHPVVRRAVSQILQGNEDIIVTGEASNGQEALEKVSQEHPDIIVLDIEMPIMDGFEVARRLRAEKNPVYILILSAYSNNSFVRTAMELGVDGYLTKDDAPQCLVEVIRRIAGGERGVFSQKAARFADPTHGDLLHLCNG